MDHGESPWQLTSRIMKKKMMLFVNDDVGLTMVEYAVAGGLVVVGAALAFTNLGLAIVVQVNALIAAM